jgi:two-component system sensor kinase FixL
VRARLFGIPRLAASPSRPEPASAPALLLPLGYVALYLLLDRLSFFQSLYGIDITPWNPQLGLTLALLIARGWSYLPVVVLAELLATRLVPLVFVPLTVAIPSVLLSAVGYGVAAAVFRQIAGQRSRLEGTREVIALIVLAIGAGAVATSGYVAFYTIAGLIPTHDFISASVQLWIGDAIGAVVVAPLVLVVSTHGRPSLGVLGHGWAGRLETAGQWCSIAGALLLVFGIGHHRYSYELFYLLFLPLVWIAVRRGVGGASWAVLTIQIGLIGLLELDNQPAATVLSFQMLMFAVATTGLMLGAAVSERVRALRALGASEKRLATILDAASDAVLMIDSRGSIEAANPAVERLFGHPTPLLIGRDLGELIEAPRPLQQLVSSEAAAQDGAATTWQLRGLRADGRAFPIELTAGPSGQADARYTLVVRDVTSRRDAELRMRLHESEVAQGSRSTLADEIATTMAHEMNQPLTAITTFARGCLRMLRDPGSDSEMIRQALEHVVEQAERAGDVIERLRELARGGACQRTATDVKVMLDAAVAIVETYATQNRVEILFDVEPDLPEVLADRIEIEQVLMNLLRNGIDAAAGDKSERRVRLGVRRAGAGSLEFTLEDSGSGVVDEVLPRLFEPFVTTKPDGMGLGLSISRSIIEAHDGRLQLVRNGAKGAVFAFSLPIVEPN